MKTKKDKKLKNQPTPVAPIVMWAIVDNAIPDEPITVTATEEEAIMALDQYLYLKHYSHFRAWCELRGLVVDHSQNWAAYAKVTFNSPDSRASNAPYVIMRINYAPSVIASLLRSVNHCVPMGLPFDTAEEINEFAERVNSVPEEELTQLERDLLLLCEDIDDDNVKEAAEIKSHCSYHNNKKKEDKKYDA